MTTKTTNRNPLADMLPAMVRARATQIEEYTAPMQCGRCGRDIVEDDLVDGQPDWRRVPGGWDTYHFGC